MGLEENKAIARRWTTDIWDRDSVDAALGAIDGIVDPGFVDHSLPPGFPEGVEGLRQQVRVFYTAFPDIYAKIDDVLAEGDTVAVRWHGGGTHQGDFFGFPPSGRKGTVTGMHIFRIGDGKIVEHWANSDDMGMMQQLMGQA